MRLFPLILSAGLAGQALAQTMAERFTVDSTCSNNNIDIDAMLTETINMVDNAISAIDILLGASSSTTSAASKQQQAAIALAANMAFAVTPPTFWFGISSGDKARLEKAQGMKIFVW
jgi:hypothetical protein